MLLSQEFLSFGAFEILIGVRENEAMCGTDCWNLSVGSNRCKTLIYYHGEFDSWAWGRPFGRPAIGGAIGAVSLHTYP